MADVFSILDPPDPWAALPALAERLGVKPFEGKRATALLHVKGGTDYDLFELIHALLDRLDQAVRNTGER